MGLDGYREFKRHYIDDGEIIENVDIRNRLSPDFRAHNTIQRWTLVPTENETGFSPTGEFLFHIDVQKMNSLVERSVHEITIKSPIVAPVVVRFHHTYITVDEELDFDETRTETKPYTDIMISSKGEAYFYATAVILKGRGLSMILRTGTKDDKHSAYQ